MNNKMGGAAIVDIIDSLVMGGLDLNMVHTIEATYDVKTMSNGDFNVDEPVPVVRITMKE
jgi:hypothetical protein